MLGELARNIMMLLIWIVNGILLTAPLWLVLVAILWWARDKWREYNSVRNNEEREMQVERDKWDRRTKNYLHNLWYGRVR